MKRAFSIVLIFVMLACMLTACDDDVPQPEITKAEFNFTVTYEFNGEVKTISGVYVCEYSGMSWAIDGGWGRDWTGYMKDGTATDMINIGTTKQGDPVELNLAFYPDYFMGDFTEGVNEAPVPYISVKMVDDEGMWYMYMPDEVEEYCGAKIISYEYDEPIKNTFR